MNEGTRQSIMAESNNLNGSLLRRSPRCSSSSTDNKMALPGFAVKRSITVRKIAPRKTVAPSEHNKENTPRRSERNQQENLKVSTPGPAPDHGLSSTGKKKKAAMPSPILPSTPGQAPNRGLSSTGKKRKAAMPSPILPPNPSPAPDSGLSSTGRKKRKAAMPSPILPSTPPPPPMSPPKQPAADAQDAAWAKKVRRSYSRLSDKSFNSPDSRDTLFGFEKLQTPEVGRRVRTAPEVSASLSGLNSFTSLLEAENDCGGSAVPEVDTNIPGVVVVKEKRRRKKVQQINTTELEELAAKMNAEFEEAEEFELFVE